MVLLFLVLGCAAPGTATPEDFAGAYTASYCDLAMACRAEWGGDPDYTYDQCVSEWSDAYAGRFTAEACGDDYSPDDAEACAEALDMASCDAGVPQVCQDLCAGG
jgi:hypothetical protein